MRAVAVALVLLATSLGGCAAVQDLWDSATRPDIPVQRTPLEDGGTHQDARFLVEVPTATPHRVEIRAVSSTGQVIEAEGMASLGNPVQVTLPDGTWTITYYVDGHKWETFDDVVIDSTPPTIEGLERVGDAANGAYTLGAGAVVEAGATVEVYGPGGLIATSLPVSLTGLASGLHVYQVVVRDQAGNEVAINVQVRAGDATALPEGQWDFGIVARYSNEARLWDLSDLDAYASPAIARTAVGQAWLGDGFGITPDEPAVQQVVAQVLSDEDTTAEIAWSLYQWLFEELEYDDERLASTTLMLPRQVITDSEDPDAESTRSQDAGDDGLADDGPGNGVHGGVCRDLAATYVSLLRAAGVPARLVTGYLAGSVDGFHAWVEFYGGDVAGNPGPWIPVDVSPINGRWDDGGDVPRGMQVAMQSFGIKHPEYLALRNVPEASEIAGWSTALGTAYTYPQSSGPPDIRFQKQVEVASTQTGSMCFDPSTMARTISTGGCGAGTYEYSDFILWSERTIDYGIQVVWAGPGTDIDVTVAYPFEGSVAPDEVTFAVYGQVHATDARAGVVTATL